MAPPFYAGAHSSYRRRRDGSGTAAALELALAGDGLRYLFQPIVDLATGEAVAYEALVRGPQGTGIETPNNLFGAAAAAGLLPDVEAACHAALRRSVADLTAPCPIFVNVEPSVSELDGDWREAREGLARATGSSGVIEIRERELIERPLELLDFARRLRSDGQAIALDGFGVDSRSLALLPLLEPDVIKLDRTLLGRWPDAAAAALTSAVLIERARTGALIVAEGVETEEELEVARSIGATHGQGWLFGRPAGSEATFAVRTPLVTPPAACAVPLRTPYGGIAAGTRSAVAGKDVLIAISRHIERQALRLGGETMLLSAFQTSDSFGRPTAARYAELAQRCALVVAVGQGLTARPAAGVRGGDIAADDPLHREWDVVLLDPNFSLALVAREVAGATRALGRTFEYVLSNDREVAVRAARALLARVLPQ